MTPERRLLRRAVAAAIYPNAFKHHPNSEQRRVAMLETDRALAAIEAHGVRLVPIDLTEDMVQAHVDAEFKASDQSPYDEWAAMLAASPYAPSSNDEKEEGR